MIGSIAVLLALQSPGLVPVQQPAGVDGSSGKLRIAVLDLSGSALKMQMAQGPGAPPGGYAQPPGYGQQTTVSIAIPPPAEFARGLTEALTTTLTRTGRFVILERAALQSVQQEQQLGASGAVTKETAAGQGGLLGAQVLITGDITGFTHDRTSVGGQITNIVKGLAAAVDRVSAEVIIDLRIIDAVTGEVLYSQQGKGKASQTGVAANLLKDEKKYDGSVSLTTPLGQASRSALTQAVAGILLHMPKPRWGARVIDVRDGQVYVNAGSGQEVKEGDELEIFAPQPALIDPESGKNLGAPDRLLGSIVIVQVAEKYAVGKITAGEGMQRGHVVRRKGAGAQP